MKTKEEIAELLKKEVEFPNCWNCKGLDDGIEPNFCEYCSSRNYSNWELSGKKAFEIAEIHIRMHNTDDLVWAREQIAIKRGEL